MTRSAEDFRRRVFVLRLGHRPQRDKRVTTHVALVARAFGAHGFVLGDVSDPSIAESVKKVVERWGGRWFTYLEGVNSVKYVKEWRRRGGMVVHLTMYGLHVDDVIDEIRADDRDILVVVGAEKVPRVFYDLADYNVAIGHQPHSEVAALAIFLDRLYGGEELRFIFRDARIYIEPMERGKKVIIVERGEQKEKQEEAGEEAEG